MESISEKHSMNSLQKTAYTRNITLQKVLQSETWTRRGGVHCWFKRSTRKKRPATRDDDDNNNNIIINISRLTKSALGRSSVINKTSYEYLCNICKVQLVWCQTMLSQLCACACVCECV
jgi:hypothetical protein